MDEDTEETIVKTAYDDTLSPMLKEIGKVPRDIIKAIRYKFTKGIQETAYKQDLLEKHLELSLKNISKENLVMPPRHILLPIIEKLQYYDLEDEIAKLYQDLLNCTFDKKKCENIHPSFLEIIPRLSQDEAKILNFFNYFNEKGELISFNSYTFLVFQYNNIFVLRDTIFVIEDNNRTKIYYEDKKSKEKKILKTDTTFHDEMLMPLHLLNDHYHSFMYLKNLELLNLIQKVDETKGKFLRPNQFTFKNEACELQHLDVITYELSDLGLLFNRVCNKNIKENTK